MALRFIFEVVVTSSGSLCYALWLGMRDYASALELQLRICNLKKQGFEPDVLLLLEHPPTITLGRNAKWNHLLVSDEILRQRGIRIFEIDRGGDITFHGPGQLVGYPILKLQKGEQDVHQYMRSLEECLIRLLLVFEIESERSAKLTGVWTEKGKIAALGVHISRWITRHGFALNVNTDLSYFDLIVPCGLADRKLASMERILSRKIDLELLARKCGETFGALFSRNILWIGESELLEKLDDHAHKITAA
jgi:lipoyl(octanoyl) transferase